MTEESLIHSLAEWIYVQYNHFNEIQNPLLEVEVLKEFVKVVQNP